MSRADRDVLMLAIAMAAIILFVGTGGQIMPQVVRSLQGIGLPPDRLLANALLLNIALIIFGLRRYRDLAREVEERRRAEERARELAETDPLTGCLNRRSIGPATDALVAACAAAGDQVAFLMIDIDNFKKINDAHGHVAGDIVLAECARRMRETVPARGLVARLGGDEFACVVPFAPNDAGRVEHLAARLTAALACPVQVGNLDVECTVSVGIARSDVATGPSRAVAADDLMHMADMAMYQAKKAGKNRYCWFQVPMENELRFRTELEEAMRAGIPAGEFVPFYEQQVDLGTGQLVGFEMLARWNSPRYGMVGPDVFIPVAEEIGLIAELSEALIRQALADARQWAPSLKLAVNISPVQLRDPWFAQKLLRLLTEANFPPNRLEVEITESCLHENLPLVSSLVDSLKNLGISVSLDDFGSGYSSLAQLRSLPFDRLKIDRSFVSGIAQPESETIVRAISSLGQGLGLPITAEGVESREVAEQLKGMGQFMAQGYHYGRPEPAERTRERLARQNLLLNSAQPPADAPPPGSVPAPAPHDAPAHRLSGAA